jgi:hypothetical protein
MQRLGYKHQFHVLRIVKHKRNNKQRRNKQSCPNTSRFPNLLASLLETAMPIMEKIIPPALNNPNPQKAHRFQKSLTRFRKENSEWAE